VRELLVRLTGGIAGIVLRERVRRLAAVLAQARFDSIAYQRGSDTSAW
jgi:hypothetical protein